MNKLEMGLIKFIIARFKSKSPKGYALLGKICGLAASVMAGYILVYNGGVLPHSFEPYAGQADNICIVAGAALSALGLGAASTTVDPDLMSNEAKQNVIEQHIVNK